ncbi:YSIRK-type signal peptide-containing protein [Staphylococcus aureus]
MRRKYSIGVVSSVTATMFYFMCIT